MVCLEMPTEPLQAQLQDTGHVLGAAKGMLSTLDHLEALGLPGVIVELAGAVQGDIPVQPSMDYQDRTL